MSQLDLKQFEIAMLQDFVVQLNQRVQSRIPAFRSRLQREVYQRMLRSPTIASIGWGQVMAELGIPKDMSNNAADRVCQLVADSVEISLEPFSYRNKQFRGHVAVYVQRLDYVELLSDPIAYIVPWTNWLEMLIDNPNPHVDGYQLLDAATLPSATLAKYSRSGAAIMGKAKDKSWQLTQMHCGTQKNNFVTRALQPNWDNFISDQFEFLLS